MRTPRIIQLILAILSECRDVNDITEMKLYKLIYFCETNYFAEKEERITPEKYMKNTYGPTPCFNPSVFEKLNDFVEIVKKGDKNYKHYYLKNGLQVEGLTGSIDMSFIKEQMKKYKYLSAADLSKLSHLDAPFLMAKHSQYINIEDVDYRIDDEQMDQVELEEERSEFKKHFSGKESIIASTINQLLKK